MDLFERFTRSIKIDDGNDAKDRFLNNREEEFIFANIPYESHHLELGSYLGKSAKAAFDGEAESVTCIDRWEYHPENKNPLKEFLDAFLKRQYKKLKLLKMNTREAYPYILANKYDSVFIDASHNNAEAMRDLCVCTLVSDLVMVHDYGYHCPDGDAKEVVDWFVRYNPKWEIKQVFERIAVLRKSK